MSGIGAAAFVEGLQGGIASRDKMDMNRQYKRLLADRADRADWQWDQDQAASKEAYGIEHRDILGEKNYEGWEAASRTKDKDPAMMQMFGWMKNKFGGMFGGGGGLGAEQSEETGATESASYVAPNIVDSPIQRPQQQQQPMMAANGGIVPRQRYADGGEVEDYDQEILLGAGAAHAAKYAKPIARGAAAAGRGAAAVPRALANSKAGPAAAGLAAIGGMQGAAESYQTDTDEYRNMLGMGRERGGDLDEDIADAESMYNRKRPEGYDELVDTVRGQGTTVYDTGKKKGAGDPWHWRNMLGFAKDVVTGGEAGGDVLARTVGTMGKVGEKVSMGMLPGPNEGGIPPQDVATTAIEANLDEPEASSEEVAQGAISEAEEELATNPDYQLLVDQGVRPDELPSMTTSDWADYRSILFERAMAYGKDAKTAMQEVDYATVDTQMRGMVRELDKAVLYLNTGQASAAAMAIRQGFQYFPNGVDVKFGTQTDPKTGQTVIIAMGTDEETGEPTGSPMLITADRLAAIRSQMSDPKAFNTWTKDGHDLQIKVDQLQSQDDYRQGSLDISAYNAQTNRGKTEAAASGAGGMSSSEQRQRSGMFQDMLQESGIMEEGMEDPDMLRDLASAMSIYQQMQPQMNPSTIMAEIMGAYKSEGDVGVVSLLESKRGQ
jgi:hypothetical protein